MDHNHSQSNYKLPYSFTSSAALPTHTSNSIAKTTPFCFIDAD